MVKRYFAVLAITVLHAASVLAAGSESDNYATWRAAAARTLVARGDAQALATAAALTFVGGPPRSKAETAKAATAALDMIIKAAELAPDDPAISWLHLHLCANAVACDIRDAATTMRWIDADNAAAWLPTLAGAQKEGDTVQVDRVLADMALGQRFDLYGNRSTVMMYGALRRSRTELPVDYLPSDLARVTEALEIAGATVMPSFSSLINACRDAASMERREDCLKLSKTMQKGDAVLTQLVGFAVEKSLTPTDGREQRVIAERRRRLEWRASSANISDTPLLPWLRNARARSRLAKMRALPREEDVDIALLKEHGIPLDPPDDRR